VSGHADNSKRQPPPLRNAERVERDPKDAAERHRSLSNLRPGKADLTPASLDGWPMPGVPLPERASRPDRRGSGWWLRRFDDETLAELAAMAFGAGDPRAVSSWRLRLLG
jgi:hypothetical protein